MPDPLTPLRFFALIPAAGDSRRMGSEKLLLPWRGKPILQHVCEAYRAGGVQTLLVVARSHDVPLATLATQLGAIVVQPSPAPPDMKSSIQCGLKQLEHSCSPHEEEAWFVAPADSPLLSPSVIARLRTTYDPLQCQALVPQVGERRGHPALIPWSWRTRLASLAPNVGLNQLLHGADTCLIDCSDLLTTVAWDDLDTPEDYRRLCEQEG